MRMRIFAGLCAALLACAPSSLRNPEDGAASVPDSREAPSAVGRSEGTQGEVTGVGAGRLETAVPGLGPGMRETLKELEVQATRREIRMHLPGDLSFRPGEYALRPEARGFLAKVAGVIRAFPGKTVQVEGFTDFTGSQAYNKELSWKRAESVRRWLVEEEGFSKTPFQTLGRGKCMPRATNRTEEGRRLNRRVEVTIQFEP
jgi:outer membrane protein OmpA-like peptidoglycan-associated protein